MNQSWNFTLLAKAILNLLDTRLDAIEAAAVAIQNYWNQQLTELRRCEGGNPAYVAIWPFVTRTGTTTNNTTGKREKNGKGGVEIVWMKNWKNAYVGKKGYKKVLGSQGGSAYDIPKLVRKVPRYAQELVKECEIPLAFLRQQAFAIGRVRGELAQKWGPAMIRDEAAWVRLNNTTDEVRTDAGLL